MLYPALDSVVRENNAPDVNRTPDNICSRPASLSHTLPARIVMTADPYAGSVTRTLIAGTLMGDKRLAAGASLAPTFYVYILLFYFLAGSGRIIR